MFSKIHKNQRIKVGARGEKGGGGNRQEEIVGSHAFDVRQAVKGRVGSAKEGEKDFDIQIGGNETRLVQGESRLTVQKDYTTVGQKNILVTAIDNISLKTMNTATGVVGIAAASRLNMQSKTSTLLKTGTAFTLTVGTAWTSTTGSAGSPRTWDHESLGNITIVGGPRIDLNPSDEE